MFLSPFKGSFDDINIEFLRTVFDSLVTKKIIVSHSIVGTFITFVDLHIVVFFVHVILKVVRLHNYETDFTSCFIF